MNGTGAWSIPAGGGGGGGAADGFSINRVASTVDSFRVTTSATANPATVQISSFGSDANTKLLLKGTGTGNVIIADASDSTKQILYSTTGLTTAKINTEKYIGTGNGTFVHPDIIATTDTLVVTNAVQTLTNKVIGVASSGTGRQVTVAYTPICGGTTTTSAMQSVASVGTAGQQLTSNGSSSLPTFQTYGARIITATSTSTLTINADITDQYELTAQAAALTIAAPTGSPADGQYLFIEIRDNATSQTISFNSIFVAQVGLTLPANTYGATTSPLYITARYDGNLVKWVVLAYTLSAGTVTQATSITTGVTLNATQGIITTVSATTAGLATSTFTLTNNLITATSNIHVYLIDYAGTWQTNGVPYVVGQTRAAGSIAVNISNLHAINALSGVLKIGFQIIN